MPSRKLSNAELLSRRLTKSLATDPKLDEEIIRLTVQAVAQLPPSSARWIRSAFSDLFCPYCAALHPLSSCTHPGVAEYRLDPSAWMKQHIPAGLQQHLAHIEVKPKRIRSVQKQNKTQTNVDSICDQCGEAHEKGHCPNPLR